jgi:hypothetical protein
MSAFLRQLRSPFSIGLFLSTAAVFSAAHGPSVLTQHNNNARTGAVLQEVQLNLKNVNAKTFGKIGALPVDDQIYAQPLIVPDMKIAGREEVNVVYVATVNNSVYAFDADDFSKTSPLWMKNYNDPAKGILPVKNTDVGQNCGTYKDFSGNIGIVGTPVIDDETDTMYFVVRTKQNNKYSQWFHAIDIKDGSERPNSPKLIEFSTPGDGEGSDGQGKIPFDSRKQNQRTALLLSQGTVYMGWASHCDTGPYHGLLAGFDAKTLELKRVFNATPGGGEGGIWQAGQGASADSDGNIYVITGNGSFDADKGGNNYGQAFVKLVPEDNGFKVASWFTPYNYEALNIEDADLGGSGALLIPDSDLVIGGGKGGTFYLLDRHNMGGYNEKNDSQIVQSIDVAQRRHIHGSPAYWEGNNGRFIYVWAENKHLRAYKFNGETFDLPAFGESSMSAPDGMPGGFLSISAYGSKAGTGILWASHPASGDANQAVRPGILRAFDASDISKELWNSNEIIDRDNIGLFAKFASPTIANGKVYAATFSGQLVVYGLLSETGSGSVPEAPAPVVAGTIYSFMSLLSNKCIDISSSSTENGAKVQQWDCNDTKAQKFMAEDAGQGFFRFKNVSSGKCLDVFQSGLENGTKLQQWACSGAANQSFKVERSVGNVVVLKTQLADKCVDIENRSLDNGAILHQWQCTGADNQRWIVKQ